MDMLELANRPTWFGSRLVDWPSVASIFGDGHINVEEYREDGALVVRAELPGLDPDRDVEISVDGNVLQVRAERTMESHAEERDGYRSEFKYGSFTRAVALPHGAVADDVSATYVDGILEVRVPLDEEAVTARKVAINRS